MMRIPYHYPKNRFHVLVLVLAFLFGLLLLIPGILFLVNGLMAGEMEDPFAITLFYWLGGAFIVAGGILLYAGYRYYRRMERFNRANEWFGLILEEGWLTSREFTGFSLQEESLPLEEITGFEERMYKGSRVLYIRKEGDALFVPIFRIAPDDLEQLHLKIKELGFE